MNATDAAAHVPDEADSRAAVRWLIRRDLDAVLRIERASYRRDFTWSREDFVLTMGLSHVIGSVVELFRPDRDPVVAGFILYAQEPRRPNEPKAQALRRYEILNLAVDPLYRGRGLGRRLVARVTHRPARRVAARIDVHEGNLTALHFFKALGWRATAVLRGAYEFDGADAIRMESRGTK